MTDCELADLCRVLEAALPPAVLDARPAAAFAGVHLRGAVSLPGVAEAAVDPVAFNRLLPSIFLPPRHRPLLVLAASPEGTLALSCALAARGRSRVRAIILADIDWSRLPPHLLERGPVVRTLWAPPGWLVAHADLLPPPALGPALDVGCGSGRAAVWLAARGWRVSGLDHQPEALALMAQLAASRRVCVTPLAADLRRPGGVPAGPWALLVNFRCLDRPLLARCHELVAPAGVAVVRTFREAPGQAPDVRAAHRLQPGELAHAFAGARWEVLAHEEGFDDDGRPAAGVIARRRAIT
jgi:SAM-dependent methyltransferase